MSGYATRLAARGMGHAAGVLLAPRAVPRAVPGAPPPTLDAAASGTRPLSTPTVQEPEQPPVRERVVEREQTTALRVDVQHGPAAQPSQSAGRRPQPAAPAAELLPASAPSERTHGVHVSTERVRTLAERQPVLQTAPRVPDVPLPQEPRGAAQAEPVAATPVELRLRPPAAPPVPASPAAGAAAQSQAPMIDVRIGRVEVRAPRPPELPGWSTSASPPVPAAPAEPPFARMAAARRYLDRGWG